MVWYKLFSDWLNEYDKYSPGLFGFLESFTTAWPGVEMADDDSDNMPLAVLDFLSELAYYFLDNIPDENYLSNVPWGGFLHGVLDDLNKEDVQDDVPGVTSAEVLEAISRNGVKLIRHPEMWAVVSAKAQTGGVGPKLALPLVLGDVLAFCNKLAAWSGENVGTPGDPYAYWQSVIDPNGVSDGGWSAPGLKKKIAKK